MLYPVILLITIQPKCPPIIKTFRRLGAYSKDTLCDTLLTATPALNVSPYTDDVDVQTDTLTSILIDCLDQCAPLVTTVIKKPFAPWISDKIRSAMATRDSFQALLKIR